MKKKHIEAKQIIFGEQYYKEKQSNYYRNCSIYRAANSSMYVDIPCGEDIDTNAQYEAVFVMYQSPTDPSDKGIDYLKFQPVEED